MADSLAAIKKLVYEEKKLTKEQLWNAILDVFSSLDSIWGVIFWFRSTPPVIFSVRSLEIDLNTAVGPLLSALWAGLQLRVAGYSAFFNVLSRKTQDDIIERTEQSL